MTLISKRQVEAVEQTLYHVQEAKTPLMTGELEFFAQTYIPRSNTLNQLSTAFFRIIGLTYPQYHIY